MYAGTPGLKNTHLHGLRSRRQDKDEAETPSPPVEDHHFERCPLADLSMSALGQANALHCKTIAGQNSLFFIQKLGFLVCWKIGKHL